MHDGVAQGGHGALERGRDGALESLSFLEAATEFVPCIRLRLSHRTRLDALATAVRMREALADGVVEDGEQKRERWLYPLRGEELELVHARASTEQVLLFLGERQRARNEGGAARSVYVELHDGAWCGGALALAVLSVARHVHR